MFWQLATNTALAYASGVQMKNRFIIKSFFQLVFIMVRKNWAHTHNFKEVVELLKQCGDREIETHLLLAPKNATKLPPQ